MQVTVFSLHYLNQLTTMNITKLLLKHIETLQLLYLYDFKALTAKQKFHQTLPFDRI